MQSWYVKMFGAKAGKRGQFDAADIPGANLTFTKSDTATVPTKGRMLDHIGFEIVGLEAFCKKAEANGLKFDMPYTKRPDLGICPGVHHRSVGNVYRAERRLGQDVMRKVHSGAGLFACAGLGSEQSSLRSTDRAEHPQAEAPTRLRLTRCASQLKLAFYEETRWRSWRWFTACGCSLKMS